MRLLITPLVRVSSNILFGFKLYLHCGLLFILVDYWYNKLYSDLSILCRSVYLNYTVL